MFQILIVLYKKKLCSVSYVAFLLSDSGINEMKIDIERRKHRSQHKNYCQR